MDMMQTNQGTGHSPQIKVTCSKHTMRVISSSEDFMFFRGDDFLFGSVFIKRNNQIDLKKLKPGQINWFRFGSIWFFRTKIGLNRFGSVFSVWLGFFRFGSVFSVWVRFGFFSLGL